MIYIDNELSIAKNLNISHNEGSVSITLPITQYYTNFDIKSSTSNIGIEGQATSYKDNSGCIYDMSVEQYNVNIKSNGKIFIN